MTLFDAQYERSLRGALVRDKELRIMLRAIPDRYGRRWPKTPARYRCWACGQPQPSQFGSDNECTHEPLNEDDVVTMKGILP